LASVKAHVFFGFLKLHLTNRVRALAAPDAGALEDQKASETKDAARAKTGSRRLLGVHYNGRRDAQKSAMSLQPPRMM
jgi:hypothetical protein